MNRFLIIIFVGIMSFSEVLSQNASDILNSGKDEFSKGNFVFALEKFETVIKTDPKTKEVYYFAGLAEYNLKNYSKAAFYFSKDIKSNRKNPRSYIYRAKAKKGFFYSDLRDIKRAERLGAEKFTVRNETASLYFENKKYKKAFKNYATLLQMKLGTDDTYYKMGLCKYYLKDNISACIYWDKISDPDDFEQYDLIEKTCSNINLKTSNNEK